MGPIVCCNSGAGGDRGSNNKFPFCRRGELDRPNLLKCQHKSKGRYTLYSVAFEPFVGTSFGFFFVVFVYSCNSTITRAYLNEPSSSHDRKRLIALVGNRKNWSTFSTKWALSFIYRKTKNNKIIVITVKTVPCLIIMIIRESGFQALVIKSKVTSQCGRSIGN